MAKKRWEDMTWEERYHALDRETAAVKKIIVVRTAFSQKSRQGAPYVEWPGLALALEEELDERDRLRAELSIRAIGRCAGCGCYIQGTGINHARGEVNDDGELYPVQCGPVKPVTVKSVEDLIDERDIAQVQARMAEEKLAQLRPMLEKFRSALLAVEALINESGGVYGLHSNGDGAPWAELRRGGQYESWLYELDEALDLIAGAGTADTEEKLTQAHAALHAIRACAKSHQWMTEGWKDGGRGPYNHDDPGFWDELRQMLDEINRLVNEGLR